MGEAGIILMLGWVSFLLTRIISHLERIEKEIEAPTPREDGT